MRGGLARIVAGTGALLGLAALALQLYLLVGVFHHQGDGVLAAAWRFLGFFTVLTNGFAVAVLAHGFLRPTDNGGLGGPRVEVAAASAMALVGVVYSLVLRQLWDPRGAQKLADMALHDVMPIVMAAYWLLRPHGRLRWGDALFCAAWPLAYAAYALARGHWQGWYPYPFIDVARIGALQTAINVAGLGVAFVLAALLFVAVDRLLSGRRR